MADDRLCKPVNKQPEGEGKGRLGGVRRGLGRSQTSPFDSESVRDAACVARIASSRL
jgi:hypothetical protein